MKRTLVTLAAALLLAVVTAPTAHAASGEGYVCYVKLTKQAPSWGKHGALFVQLYSQPACAGGYVGYGLVFSQGANNPAWAGSFNSTYVYSDVALQALMQNLHRAAVERKKVRFHGVSSGSAQIQELTFYGK